MRICKNDITDIIADLFGANALKIPESRIQPLCLLEIEDNKPVFLGEFRNLVRGSFDHGVEIKTSFVSEVSDVKTEKVSIGFGLKILENFLKAFRADPVTISLALSNSKKISFAFSDVQRKYFEPLELGKILSENKIYGDQKNMFIKAIIKNKNLRLALITDVLVSNNFSMSTYDEGNSAVKIDIPLIQGYISGAGLDLKVESSSDHEVKFNGPEALTFAFSCVEIRIDSSGRISKGDWLRRIRSAKGLDTVSEAEISNEELNRSARFQIDDNRANPLLFEL